MFLDPVRVAVVKGIDPGGPSSDLRRGEHKRIHDASLLPQYRSLDFEGTMAQNLPLLGEEPARPTTLWCQTCLRHAQSNYTVNIRTVIDPAVCVFSQAVSYTHLTLPTICSV